MYRLPNMHQSVFYCQMTLLGNMSSPCPSAVHDKDNVEENAKGGEKKYYTPALSPAWTETLAIASLMEVSRESNMVNVTVLEACVTGGHKVECRGLW